MFNALYLSITNILFFPIRNNLFNDYFLLVSAKMQMDMNSFRNTTKIVLRNCFLKVKPPLVEK